MKKILLFAFLLLFSIAHSQINTQVTPLDVCDDNNDGFAVFNLSDKNSEVLLNLNPAIHTVSYHETNTNAINGVNALSASNYTNINSPVQTIFVRVVNTQTSTVYITTLTLRVFPSPIINPATLTFCGPGLPIYNLNNAAGQIINGQPNTILVYHETEVDAQVGANAIGNTNAYSPITNPQILYVRAFDPVMGCASITTLTLNVCSLIAPTNVAVSSVTNTSAVVSWTENNSFTFWEISVVPFGQPPSVNGIFSQSNPFTITGLSPDTCYTVYVRSGGIPGAISNYPWSQPVNFCMVNCANNASCPESLSLVAFLDSNNNGVKETNETVFNNGTFNYQVNNSGSTIYGNTNNGTFTIFENNPANLYSLNFAVNSNLTSYFSSATNFNNISVPTGSGSNTYYFPVTQLQAFNDLEIQIIPTSAPRPGFTYTNHIIYKNNGTQNVASGTVTFTKNPSVSITAISQSGTASSPSGFSYNFTNLAPNESRIIDVTMLVPTIPTVNLGNVLTNSVAITPTTGDAFPINNSASLSQIVVGSYDPNDKAESHGGKIAITSFTANDYLTYTIRFENTGTANASFIRVEDFLNSSLNLNSVEVLNASHPFNFRRINNKLFWNFYTINLPPTSTSPTLSHGFVQFRVKPNAGYSVGTIIPNSAEIYFDYNPPIYTNTFNTEFVQTLNNTSFSNADFVLYPNPASDFVQINLQNDSDKIKNVTIYDMVGKAITSATDINSSEAKIATSELSKGLYLIEITSNNNLKQTKKLIIK